MTRNYTLLTFFSLLPFIPTAHAQLGCAGAGEGSLTVQLINVSAADQGQDATLTAEYEYSFFFSVNDGTNSGSSGCWTWDPNDNQANSVTPGTSSTANFSFDQSYNGCTSYGINADVPTQLFFGFDGWEDDNGNRCSYTTGTFVNNDDDRATCNNNTLNLANIFVSCPGGAASYDYTWSCGDYSMTYRITLNLPLFDPTIAGVPANPICNSSGPVSLSANTPGGTWSGTGLDAAGVFDPTGLASGNYTVNYTGVNGCATTSSSASITVINPDPGFDSPPISVCVDHGPVALNPFEAVGSWTVTEQNGGTGIVINNEFHPGLSGPGVYMISYTVGNSSLGCMETGVAVNTIEVTPLPVFEIQGPQVQTVPCDIPFILSAIEVGSATTGNHTFAWDGRHIVGATTGTSIEVSSSVGDIADYTLTVTDGNGCTNTASFILTFDCALPIELLYFDAKAVGYGVDLDWATASEYDNEGFSVLRSTDGLDFREIDFVKGEGNAVSRTDYKHFDQGVLPATLYYYKLHQVDLDGTEMTSNVVSVMTNERGTGPDVFISNAYPNPVKGTVNMDVNSPLPKQMQVAVYDMTGRLLLQGTREIQAGFTQLDIDLSDLPTGLLNVVMKMDSRVYHRKVLKVNH